jgi:hypothetical protein
MEDHIVHRSRDKATSCRLALILASAVAWMSPEAPAAALDVRTAVTVRVYHSAGLSSRLERRALAEAETVLRTARVDVRWERCSGPTLSPACDRPAGRSELVLQIVADKRQDSIMGTAVVLRGAGGVFATVYASQVARVAQQARSDVAVLLGRVAAHELGHLMMNTTAHSRRGLMRANWTPGEVRRNVAIDWAFTPEDLTAMRLGAPDFRP